MLNPSHVSMFLAVIDAGSFHGAAERLGVSQSTVSHGLQRLEAAIGERLVLRRRDGCVASRQGETFLPFARAIVSTCERALARLKTQRLRIGASSNVGIYLLQPRLRRLVDAGLEQPDLVIGPNPAIAAHLERRQIDIGLMEWWDGRPGLLALPWDTRRLVVIVAPAHPWASRGRVDVETLVAVPLLAGEKGTGTGRLLRQALGPVADRLAVSHELGSTEAVKRAVAAGLGVSIVLEDAVTDEVASGRLSTVPLAGPSLRKPLWSIVPEELASSGRMVEALELLGTPPRAVS